MPKVMPTRNLDERWCCGCKQFQKKSDFSRHSKRKGGLNSWCKPCSRRYERGYVEQRREVRKRGRSTGTLWYWREKLKRNSVDCPPEEFQKKYFLSPFCTFCGTSLLPSAASIDHWIPRSRNGGDGIRNLVVSCIDCNRLKHTRTGEEFKVFLLEYAGRILGNKAEDRKVTAND
jgi:5-methylcytosine-specific restriction endonuclease McrA